VRVVFLLDCLSCASVVSLFSVFVWLGLVVAYRASLPDGFLRECELTGMAWHLVRELFTSNDGEYAGQRGGGLDCAFNALTPAAPSVAPAIIAIPRPINDFMDVLPNSWPLLIRNRRVK